MTSPAPSRCPVCGSPCFEIPGIEPSARYIQCLRCGSFTITGAAISLLGGPTFDDASRDKLSSHIFENTDLIITHSNIGTIKDIKIPSVPERGERLFRYLVRKLDAPGSDWAIPLVEVRDVVTQVHGRDSSLLFQTSTAFQRAESLLPLMAVSWSHSPKELFYLLDGYLGETKQLLDRPANQVYRISGRGWEYVSSSPPRDSSLGFIAMNFANEYDEFYVKGIEQAVRAAGYKSVRIDRHQHVNRIDDEIIAQLRRSKFVVADFTGQRNGVYFEAGFGLGLGIPVFWTCRSDDLKNVHFDARQYNAIKWDPDKLADFSSALSNRIVALLGQGPLTE